MARYKFADTIADGTAPTGTIVKPGRAFYNGDAASNIQVELVDGTGVTFSNCPTGIIPVAFAKVLAGTTSTKLLALQ
jgi:hypothetical protein